MDKLDRDLLNIIQSHFPLTAEPYAELAGMLGTSAGEIIKRLEKLTENGTIRRLGSIFDSRGLGYTGTLCAMQVPPEMVEPVAEIVNGYSGVTHNYLRNHRYNMWFTLLAPDKKELGRIMEEIKARSGISEMISLPAVKTFKIKVNFHLMEGRDDQ